MDKVSFNVQMPHGVDALRGDATAPVITTQAEKSALNENVEKEGDPQRTEMQENQGGDLRQPDSTEPGDYRVTRAGREEPLV